MLSTKQFPKKKDFLNCAERTVVTQTLQKYSDKIDNSECFSDFVFLYDKKMKKRRVAILITVRHIYLMELKGWKLMYVSELRSLRAVSIASKNCVLFALHFTSGSDLLLENYRRIDLVLYCSRILKEADLPLPKLQIRKKFSSTPDGRDTEDKEKTAGPKTMLSGIAGKDLEKAQKTANQNPLQETIRNSRKAGYLRSYKKSFLGSVTFNESFFVLSDLGLVSFKKFGDKKATGFYPILGGSVQPVPKSTHGREFVFSVKFAEEESILQATSLTEMEDWIKQIKDLQEKSLTAKDTIKEIGRVI